MSDACQSRLIVALDCRSGAAALELVGRLGDAPIAMMKVGSELFTAAGPELVRNLGARGHRVFLDLKFHDIPNTVAGAAAASARLGIAMLDVHASGGVAMMRAARRAAVEAAQGVRVIAVTLLTSLDQQDVARLGLTCSPGEQVLRLADMAAEAGLDGVVASPAEVVELRRRFPPPFLLVAPGIRPAWAGEAGDQKRLATPGEAIAAGADFIVVGRSITGTADPRQAALRVIEEIASAGSPKI